MGNNSGPLEEEDSDIERHHFSGEVVDIFLKVKGGIDRLVLNKEPMAHFPIEFWANSM